MGKNNAGALMLIAFIVVMLATVGVLYYLASGQPLPSFSILGASKIDVTSDASLSSTKTYWSIPITVTEGQDKIYGIYLSRKTEQNTQTAYDVEFGLQLDKPAQAIYKFSAWDSSKPINAFACPPIFIPGLPAACLPQNPLVGYEANVAGDGIVKLDYTFIAKRLQNGVNVESNIQTISLPYSGDVNFFNGKVKLQNIGQIDKGYIPPSVADAKVLYITDMATLKKNAGFDKDCSNYGGSGNSCYIVISNAAYTTWKQGFLNNVLTKFPSTPPNSWTGTITQSSMVWQFPSGARTALVNLWIDASWVGTIAYQPPTGTPCNLQFSVEPNAQYGKEYTGTISIKNCGNAQGQFDIIPTLTNAQLTYISAQRVAPQAGATQTSTFKYIPNAGKFGGGYSIKFTVTDSWSGSSTGITQAGVVSAAPVPKCGNGICDSDEGCSSCTSDCGNCIIPDIPGITVRCGDGRCNGNENYLTCPTDCTSPQETCGNHVCTASAGETYNSCPADCPPPSPVCSQTNLVLCTTKGACEDQKGYWYSDKCNATQQGGVADWQIGLAVVVGLIFILAGVVLALKKK